MSAEQLKAFPKELNEYKQGSGLEAPHGRRNTAILYGIRDIEDPTAKKVGLEIVNRILHDPNINRVVFMGAPGLGKTVDREQLRHELIRLSGKKIRIRTVTYDDVLAQCEEEWGRREGWGEDKWYALNERIAQEAEVRPVSEGDGDVREVTFLEMVGVGKKWPRDRGVTALELIAKKEKEENKTGQTIYKMFFPDWQTQRHAAQMRDDVLNEENEVPNEQVWQVLLNYNVYVTGDKLIGKLESTRGAIIKELLRKSARLEHIEKINAEMVELAKETGAADKDGFFSEPTWRRVLRMPQKKRQNMNLIASYLRNVMESLEIPKEFRYIVVNPYKPKGLIYWFVD